jgi:hypothetical protein
MTRQTGSPGVDLPELHAAWDGGLVKDEGGRYLIPAKAGEPRVEIDCSCGWGLNAPERLSGYMTDRHAAAHSKGTGGLAAAATWDIRHLAAEQPGPEPEAR